MTTSQERWTALGHLERERLRAGGVEVAPSRFSRRLRRSGQALLAEFDISLPGGDDEDETLNVMRRLEWPPPRRSRRRGTTKLHAIPAEQFDFDPQIESHDEQAASRIEEGVVRFRNYFDTPTTDWDGSADPAGPTIPPAVVDRRKQQSPVRDQGRRQTCVAHAALGCLEARLTAAAPVVLSPQHAHFNFMTLEGRPHDVDRGIKATDAPRYLSQPGGAVCPDTSWPYEPSPVRIATAVAAGAYGPPPEALDGDTYRLSAYKLIAAGNEGATIGNVRHLESLLAAGYDIVVGAWLSWEADEDDILRPVFANGEPVFGGGHAMLIVGYDRDARVLLLKNSAGPGWQDGGYGWFSYEFAELYFRYGWVAEAD